MVRELAWWVLTCIQYLLNDETDHCCRRLDCSRRLQKVHCSRCQNSQKVPSIGLCLALSGNSWWRRISWAGKLTKMHSHQSSHFSTSATRLGAGRVHTPMRSAVTKPERSCAQVSFCTVSKQMKPLHTILSRISFNTGKDQV